MHSAWNVGGCTVATEQDWKTLKLTTCIIVLLGFVAAIMWTCGAWNTRVFIMYAVTAVTAEMTCTLSDD